MSNSPDEPRDRDDDRDDRRDRNRDRDDRDRDDDDRRDRRDERDIRDAKGLVQVPAIGLILVAIFGFLAIPINLVQLGSIDASFDAEIKKMENNPQFTADQKKQQKELMTKIRDWTKMGILPYLGIIGLASLVTLLGGIKLMKLSSPGLVMFGSILSMIPCTSGCCMLGLVFGIWAIVVMGKPEVKAGFAAQRRLAAAPLDRD
jgi:hypothetical protein